MPYSGHDWNRARGHSPYHVRIVERDEVILAASPSDKKDHVDILEPRSPGESLNYRIRSVYTLDHTWDDHHVQRWISLARNLQDISDGCAGGRGYTTYPARIGGYGLFSGLVEEPLL